MGLLKIWPKTLPLKEVLFINELKEIINSIKQAEFQKIMIPLFKQLTKCILSTHSQVIKFSLFQQEILLVYY